MLNGKYLKLILLVPKPLAQTCLPREMSRRKRRQSLNRDVKQWKEVNFSRQRPGIKWESNLLVPS